MPARANKPSERLKDLAKPDEQPVGGPSQPPSRTITSNDAQTAPTETPPPPARESKRPEFPSVPSHRTRSTTTSTTVFKSIEDKAAKTRQRGKAPAKAQTEPAGPADGPARTYVPSPSTPHNQVILRALATHVTPHWAPVIAREDLTDITERVKSFIRGADPNGGRCIVTNKRAPYSQFAHMLAKATEMALARCLQRALYSRWNLTLHLNSRFNVLCMGSSEHDDLDRGHWFPLPHPKLIEIIYEAYVEKKNHNYDIFQYYEEYRKAPYCYRFEYFLVPLNSEIAQWARFPRFAKPVVDMENTRVDALDIDPLDGEFVEPRMCGYGDVPKVVSHVFPHFVICNAAQKLITRGNEAYLPSQARINTVKNTPGHVQAELYEYDLSNVFDMTVALFKEWKELGAQPIPQQVVNPEPEPRNAAEPDPRNVGEPLEEEDDEWLPRRYRG